MELTLKILCACGKELDATESHLSRGTIIEVQPCPDCIEKKYDEGRTDGHNEGFKEGKVAGYDEASADVELLNGGK